MLIIRLSVERSLFTSLSENCIVALDFAAEDEWNIVFSSPLKDVVFNTPTPPESNQNSGFIDCLQICLTHCMSLWCPHRWRSQAAGKPSCSVEISPGLSESASRDLVSRKVNKSLNISVVTSWIWSSESNKPPCQWEFILSDNSESKTTCWRFSCSPSLESCLWKTLSSIVPEQRNLYSYTSFFWPSLHILAIACLSFAGFQSERFHNKASAADKYLY